MSMLVFEKRGSSLSIQWWSEEMNPMQGARCLRYGTHEHRTRGCAPMITCHRLFVAVFLCACAPMFLCGIWDASCGVCMLNICLFGMQNASCGVRKESRNLISKNQSHYWIHNASCGMQNGSWGTIFWKCLAVCKIHGAMCVARNVKLLCGMYICVVRNVKCVGRCVCVCVCVLLCGPVMLLYGPLLLWSWDILGRPVVLWSWVGPALLCRHVLLCRSVLLCNPLPMLCSWDVLCRSSASWFLRSCWSWAPVPLGFFFENPPRPPKSLVSTPFDFISPLSPFE